MSVFKSDIDVVFTPFHPWPMRFKFASRRGLVAAGRELRETHVQGSAATAISAEESDAEKQDHDHVA